MQHFACMSAVFWILAQALEIQQGVNHMKCLNSWALTAKGGKQDLESDKL